MTAKNGEPVRCSVSSALSNARAAAVQPTACENVTPVKFLMMTVFAPGDLQSSLRLEAHLAAHPPL